MNEIFTVYIITINDKKYIGATSNYESRLRTHNAGLKKLIKTGKLDNYTLTFKLVDINELKEYGYSISIYAYCNDYVAAKQVEQNLMDKYKNTGLLLNVCEKSGYTQKPKTERKLKHKGRTSEQLAYLSTIKIPQSL